MIVVADTSPLNYLVQLGLETLLAESYEQVLVPAEVVREMNHVRTPPVVRGWISNPPSWLRIIPIRELDITLPNDLGRGEAEAISLAIELKSMLLVDDLWGRREAELRSIKTAGTLSILVEGALKGRLDLQVALGQLRNMRFRMSDEVAEMTMERYLTRKRALKESRGQ